MEGQSGICCGPIECRNYFHVKLFLFLGKKTRLSSSSLWNISSTAHNNTLSLFLALCLHPTSHRSCRSRYALLPSLLLPHNPTQESVFSNPETPPFFVPGTSQNSSRSDLFKNNLITNLSLRQHLNGKTCSLPQQACTLSMSLVERLLHVWSHLFFLGLWREVQLLIAYHSGW